MEVTSEQKLTAERERMHFSTGVKNHNVKSWDNTEKPTRTLKHMCGDQDTRVNQAAALLVICTTITLLHNFFITTLQT